MIGAAFIIIWFLAGLLTGLTSFGGNMFALPLISLFFPVQEAIFSGCVIGTAISGVLAFHYRKHILWRYLLLLAITTFSSLPAGTYILKYTSEKTLLLGAAFVISVFLVWQFVNSRLPARKGGCPAWLVILMGLLSGVLAGSTSLGGAPMALVAYMGSFTKQQAIGTLNFIGMLGLIGALVSQIFAGLYSPRILDISIYGIVAAALGTVLSFPLIRYMPEKIFRGFLLGMLCLSVIMLIYRAFA